MIFLCRYPVLIKINKPAHSFYKNFFRNSGHLHAFRRNIKAPVIIVRPVYVSVSVLILISFYAFKNGLSVMQCSDRWTQYQWLVWLDLNIFPFSIFIICFKHVVSKIFSKWYAFRYVLKFAALHFFNRYASHGGQIFHPKIFYFVSTKKQTNFGATKNAGIFYKQLLV